MAAKKFNQKERDEFYSLALKLNSGVQLDAKERAKWGRYFKRFSELKKEQEDVGLRDPVV